MLDRADGRRLEGEVVDVLGDEVPVGDVERGGDHVVGDVLRALGGEHDRRDHGDEGEHRRGRRQQAAGPPGVEVAQREPSGPLQLAEDQPGDEEAREDEEQVERDEATFEARDLRVRREHQDEGEASDALDVEPESTWGLGPRDGRGDTRHPETPSSPNVRVDSGRRPTRAARAGPHAGAQARPRSRSQAMIARESGALRWMSARWPSPGASTSRHGSPGRSGRPAGRPGPFDRRRVVGGSVEHEQRRIAVVEIGDGTEPRDRDGSLDACRTGGARGDVQRGDRAGRRRPR